MQLVALHSAFLYNWRPHGGPQNLEQQHQKMAAAVLQQHTKPGDRWLFVRCGNLLDSLPGPGSAAVAVLQLWPAGDSRGDYQLWRLGHDGLPTGDTFFSLTGI
jgi:hypothetical protein